MFAILRGHTEIRLLTKRKLPAPSPESKDIEQDPQSGDGMQISLTLEPVTLVPADGLTREKRAGKSLYPKFPYTIDLTSSGSRAGRGLGALRYCSDELEI